MKNTVNVLVTAVGSTTALSVIKALRKNEQFSCHIVGTDANHLNVAGKSLCDTFHFLPHVGSGSYGESLENIALKEQVDVVIPIIDCEVEYIASRREELTYCRERCLIPAVDVVRTCNDKYKLAKAMTDWPEFGHPSTVKAEKALLNKIDLSPGFLKPRNGISSIDCFKINDRKELEVFSNRVENAIVSDFLSGNQYVIDTLSDQDGNCLVSVPRREYEAKAGVGVKAQISMDPELVDYGKRLVETLGIVGPACIELMKDGASMSLIEVNARTSASLALTVAAGVNFPSLIVDLVLGNPVTPSRLIVKKPDLYMSRYWEEIYYDKAQCEDG